MKIVFASLACLIIALAIFLRVWHLPAESLDGDELFSRRVALARPPAALDMVEQDLVHPPLYYLVLREGLSVTGDGAIGIRELSIFCGVASIAVVLAWGFALPVLRRAAFLASALIALNTLDIYYSQQARSYALYGLWVCLLILWALVLERYGQKLWFWIVGTALMVLTVYTHYVGALFIAAVFFSTVLTKNVSAKMKIRMTMVTAIAAFAFLPWLVAEIGVYKSKHGFGANVAWQGIPTGYDLRALWADFMGLPPQIRGGTTLALAVGILLAGFAVFRSVKGQSLLSGRVTGLLAATAILPPLLLFATSFKPLSLTVFGERHLLPSIFAALVLVAFGLDELSRAFSRPALVWVLGAICLCSLQLAALSRAWAGPTRQPYDQVAAELKTVASKREPVYTTWPYGIAETVNFYLGTDRVQPLPAVPAMAMPKQFVILYRPGVPKEQDDLTKLLGNMPGSELSQCRYYATSGSTFGTRMCVVGPGNS